MKNLMDAFYSVIKETRYDDWFNYINPDQETVKGQNINDLVANQSLKTTDKDVDEDNPNTWTGKLVWYHDPAISDDTIRARVMAVEDNGKLTIKPVKLNSKTKKYDLDPDETSILANPDKVHLCGDNDAQETATEIPVNPQLFDKLQDEKTVSPDDAAAISDNPNDLDLHKESLEEISMTIYENKQSQNTIQECDGPNCTCDKDSCSCEGKDECKNKKPHRTFMKRQKTQTVHEKVEQSLKEGFCF